MCYQTVCETTDKDHIFTFRVLVCMTIECRAVRATGNHLLYMCLPVKHAQVGLEDIPICCKLCKFFFNARY